MYTAMLSRGISKVSENTITNNNSECRSNNSGFGQQMTVIYGNYSSNGPESPVKSLSIACGERLAEYPPYDHKVKTIRKQQTTNDHRDNTSHNSDIYAFIYLPSQANLRRLIRSWSNVATITTPIILIYISLRLRQSIRSSSLTQLEVDRWAYFEKSYEYQTYDMKKPDVMPLTPIPVKGKPHYITG